MKAYWFSQENGTTLYLKVPAEIGRTDRFDDVAIRGIYHEELNGELEPCCNGLHASPTPFDALWPACGPVMWEVEIDDDAVLHNIPVDKYVSRTREYLRKVDVTPILRRFSAQRALSVIHLWAAPEIVVQYLQDEALGKDRSDIRDSARAAGDAARTAAGDAVWAAARNAAWDATRTAPWDIAWGSSYADKFNKAALVALEEQSSL